MQSIGAGRQCPASKFRQRGHQFPGEVHIVTIPAGYQPLAGSQRPRPASSTLVGPFEATATISATVLLRQRPGAPALPDLAYWEQIPPGQRTFLSADEPTLVYGAAQTDVAAVTTFVNSQGMTVVESHLGRRTVIVKGTAPQWNSAFGVELNQYQAPLPQNPYGVIKQTPGTAAPNAPTAPPAAPAMQTHRGFDGPLYLPPALSGVVSSVIGLDNRIAGCRAGTGDPPSSIGLTVPQLAGLYNFPNTGAACQTIGVFAPSPAAYFPGDILGSYFPGLPPGFREPPNIVDINLTVDGTVCANNPAPSWLSPRHSIRPWPTTAPNSPRTSRPPQPLRRAQTRLSISPRIRSRDGFYFSPAPSSPMPAKTRRRCSPRVGRLPCRTTAARSAVPLTPAALPMP